MDDYAVHFVTIMLFYTSFNSVAKDAVGLSPNTNLFIRDMRIFCKSNWTAVL